MADSGSVWIWFDNKAPSVCSQAPYVTRMGVGEVQDGVELEIRRHHEGAWERGELVKPLREAMRNEGRNIGFDIAAHFLAPEMGRVGWGWERALGLAPFLSLLSSSPWTHPVSQHQLRKGCGAC